MLLSAIELPNNNTTDGFLEKLIDSSTNPRAYGHFWRRFWSIGKYLAFLHYLIIINSFQTL